jgi:hypothetical protein
MTFKAKANQDRAEQAQSRAGEERERSDGLLVRDHGDIIHCIRSCKDVRRLTLKINLRNCQVRASARRYMEDKKYNISNILRF